MGPLHGVRVVEMAGLGAAPYGCMMLADLGADVVRINRRLVTNGFTPDQSPLLRSRRSISLDIKNGIERYQALALVEKADVLVEGFRPGVMERLGLGPELCLQRNPRLVYARMTGWGQTGPLANAVGHDLNYIGLSGILHQIGPIKGKPTVPSNVIGDFGGGLLMAFGIVSALLEAKRSGLGQVVDAAMLDVASSFMAMSFGNLAAGQFSDQTGFNFLGGAAHYYDVYECADGKCISVAALEPQFYEQMVKKLDLNRDVYTPAGFPNLSDQTMREVWPRLKDELTSIFKQRDRDEWSRLFGETDACIQPVLTLAEAPNHAHNQARMTFLEVGGVVQNAPAPRFSRTVPDAPRPSSHSDVDARAILAEWTSIFTTICR